MNINIKHTHQHATESKHVHLAPTAEHMRLLNEFKREARKSVEDMVPIPTITLGDITTYRDRENNQVRVLFSINGHRHSAVVDDERLALERVAHTIAAQITEKLFVEIMSKAVK